MKGRYRIINEHELATLIRKAGRVDYYEHHIAQSLLEEAKKKPVKFNQTYHQFASSKDGILTDKYSISQDTDWISFEKDRPEEGIEVLITWDGCPNDYYIATYFDDDYVVIADWNDDDGYYSKYIKVKNYKNIRWKEISINK